MKDPMDLTSPVETNKANNDWQMGVEEFDANGCLVNSD